MPTEQCSVFPALSLFGKSGLVHESIAKKIERSPVQTPLESWPGLGTQSCFEAPDEIWVKTVEDVGLSE